jgi:hypothetical protein
MSKPTVVMEDEVIDALEFTGEASTRHCPKCKRRTPHAYVIQIVQGSVTQGWQCLKCGCLHD